jgi:hypothetical protein
LTVKSWNPGDVLTAADMNAWTVPLVAYRTSTQSVTSSTTLQNDNQISVSVYIYTMVYRYAAANPGGMKSAFTAPAGATVTMNTYSFKNDQSAVIIYDGAVSTAGFGTGTTCSALVHGMVTVSSTAGTLQMQWCQFASSATATRMFADTHLILQRVG